MCSDVLGQMLQQYFRDCWLWMSTSISRWWQEYNLQDAGNGSTYCVLQVGVHVKGRSGLDMGQSQNHWIQDDCAWNKPQQTPTTTVRLGVTACRLFLGLLPRTFFAISEKSAGAWPIWKILAALYRAKASKFISKCKWRSDSVASSSCGSPNVRPPPHPTSSEPHQYKTYVKSQFQWRARTRSSTQSEGITNHIGFLWWIH